MIDHCRTLFAIGDVHGRLDLLGRAFDAISGRIGAAGYHDAVVVVLGDMIDRGPDGVACLRLARAGHPLAETVALPGNHELMMVSALRDPPESPSFSATSWQWLRNGGKAVARELAVEADHAAAPRRWRDAMLAGLGEDLLEWLEARPLAWRDQEVVCVHAGIDPTADLETTLGRPWTECWDDDSPLWIRSRFLSHVPPYPGGVTVVHGHSQFPQPLVMDGRIGLDIGAYRSDRLAVLELAGGLPTIHEVRP